MQVSHIFKELAGQTMTEDNSTEILTNMIMELVERLGNFPKESKNIDKGAWENLLIYAPKPTPVAWRLTMNDRAQTYLDCTLTELEHIARMAQSTDYVIEPLGVISQDYMTDQERRKALLVKAKILDESGNYHPDYFSEETISGQKASKGE